MKRRPPQRVHGPGPFGHVLLFLGMLCGLSAPAEAESGASGEATGPNLALRFYQNTISDLRLGDCFFEPSCSQYARDAFAEHGFLHAAALTADRLIRCNPSARAHHRRDENDRLLDPASGPSPLKTRPKLPAWLLPAAPAFPDAAALDEGMTSTLRAHAAFAEDLESGGDCWRAGTEYKRIAFLAASPVFDYWSRMRIAWCSFGNDVAAESAAEFVEAALHARTDDERSTALFLAASAHFDAAGYDRCRRLLKDFMPSAAATDPPSNLAGREQALLGLCLMAEGSWEESARRFVAAERWFADPADRRRSAYLARQAHAGHGLSSKRPALAAAMSALVPGSGQAYASRYRNGLRHLLFNGLLGLWIVHLMEDENYAGAYLVAGVTVPFYLGNIMGANRSALEYNQRELALHLSRSIAATEH